MAKQRRARSRPVRSTPTQAARRPTVPAPSSPPGAAPKAPITRQSYIEAVALYEQGVAALQAHDYSRASSILRSVLSRYPDEKELHERVRLYLNVCDRHMAPGAGAPSTSEERVFAATLAFNAGSYDEAIEQLRKAVSQTPDHDHALYLLASVLAIRNRAEEAVPHLLRAIDLNPDNRSQARHDPDLEPLRQHDAVRAALETTPSPKSERRKSARRSR